MGEITDSNMSAEILLVFYENILEKIAFLCDEMALFGS
jgi:hypothetical protein